MAMANNIGIAGQLSSVDTYQALMQAQKHSVDAQVREELRRRLSPPYGKRIISHMSVAEISNGYLLLVAVDEGEMPEVIHMEKLDEVSGHVAAVLARRALDGRKEAQTAAAQAFMPGP